MSLPTDPLGKSQDDQMTKSDLFVANMGDARVAGLIDPADSAAATADNLAMHRDKLASEKADAAAKEATKDKTNTFASAEKNQRARRKRIMAKTTYTKAAGELLGLETSPAASPGFADDGPAPVLRGKALLAGGAELRGQKLGAEASDLYGKRGAEADFTLIKRVLKYPYVDNRPLLVAHQPEERLYYEQPVSGDAPAGPASAIIKVIVTG